MWCFENYGEAAEYIDQLEKQRDRLAAELAKLAKQKPALYMAFSDCGNFIRYWTRDTKNLEATMSVNDFEVLEFYAAPVPAPSMPTDEHIRAVYRAALGQSVRERDMPEIRKFVRALLQSAEALHD
jgi:hypothetical protein